MSTLNIIEMKKPVPLYMTTWDDKPVRRLGLVGTRLDLIKIIPGIVIVALNCIGSTILGAHASLAVVVTLGKVQWIYRDVSDLAAARMILPILFATAVSFADPTNLLDIGTENEIWYEPGLVTMKFAKLNSACNFQPSRIKILASSSFMALAKIVDLALGLIAGSLALLALGDFEELNEFALQQLRAFDVITLPFGVLCGLVNPKSSLTHDLQRWFLIG